MKCKFCGSEWQTENEVKTCPFCGKSLTEPPVFLDVVQALRFILSTYGKQVNKNPNCIIAYLSDLAPKLTNERRLLKMCADAGIIAELLPITDQTEKNLAARRAVAVLSSNYFLDAKWAETAVGWLTVSMGWTSPGSVSVIQTPPEKKEGMLREIIREKIDEPKDSIVSIQQTNTAARKTLLPQEQPVKKRNEQAKTPVIQPTAPNPWAQKERIRKRREDLKQYAGRMVSGGYHILALRSDGTVIAAGNNDDGQCNVEGWRDITSITCTAYASVGLTTDGKILYMSSYASHFPAKGYRSWQDIVQVVALPGKLTGLCSDGRVMCSEQSTVLFRKVCGGACREERCKYVSSDWRNVTAIDCSTEANYGLLADGTVVACGSNEHGQCNVGSWRNVASIAVGDSTVYGLRKDGRVYSQGYYGSGKCDVSSWRDIVDIIPAGIGEIFGLKADGSVVYAGNIRGGLRRVSEWTDIVALDAGGHIITGLRADGTVVALTNAIGGRCDTSGWRDIVAVTCGCGGVFGLQADGTVVYAGASRNDIGKIVGQNLFH